MAGGGVALSMAQCDLGQAENPSGLRAPIPMGDGEKPGRLGPCGHFCHRREPSTNVEVQGAGHRPPPPPDPTGAPQIRTHCTEWPAAQDPRPDVTLSAEPQREPGGATALPWQVTSDLRLTRAPVPLLMLPKHLVHVAFRYVLPGQQLARGPAAGFLEGGTGSQGSVRVMGPFLWANVWVVGGCHTGDQEACPSN